MGEVISKISSGVLLDGRYKLLRPLNSDGGTADVWLALDTNTIDAVYDDDKDLISSEEESGIKVAIKIYRPKNALDLGEQRFREEFKIVFNCHHTNLVQPINFSIFEGIPYLVLPYCQKGSSEQLQGKIKDADELWRYISDVSAGLAYLHAFNPTIVHHDIKPANILIDDNNNYAITDFGISSHRGNNRDECYESQSGTMAYMAPERFQEDYESIPESDIWSFGATLYELITGKVPFGENGGAEQLETNAVCPTISENIPADIKKLIYDCLSADVSKRPSASLINKAASNKSYSIKNRKHIYVGIGVLLAIFLLLAALIPREDNTATTIAKLSDEQIYDNAMTYVNSKNADDLRHGMSILDSLGKTGYIPAIYQQAFTYEWYKDSASVARKKLLDIDFYTNGEKAYLPKDKQINLEAISLFNKIEKNSNPAYPDINANALYILALYNVNPNGLIEKDEERAKNLLMQAKEWAKQSNNQPLLNAIQNGIDLFTE
ncbi:MAG: serine/threonine protein kinase [Roseburia sp.]|nr:serine/threonine protein kinase [Roseburia sp.]